MLNLVALIVRPSRLYHWAATLDDAGLVDVTGARTVYLICGFEYDVEAERILKEDNARYSSANSMEAS